jgi:hypothetical protein
MTASEGTSPGNTSGACVNPVTEGDTYLDMARQSAIETRNDDLGQLPKQSSEPLDPPLDGTQDYPILSTRDSVPIVPQGHYDKLRDRFKVEDESRPMTWAEAREKQLHHLIGARNSALQNGWTPNPNRQYRRIVNTCRMCQQEYDDLHTVMLSLRLSPTTNHWLPPGIMFDAVWDAWRKRAKDRLRRFLDKNAGRWEYVEVIAGTDYFASPHYHIYVWVDGAVKPSDFEHVVDAYVADCPFAPDDGTGHDIEGRAVIVRGPDDQEYATDHAVRDDLNAEHGVPTKGAVYVAGQIPNLVEYDQYTDDDGKVKARIDPPRHVLDHGVTADASTHTAVSFSQGCWDKDRDGKVVGPIGSTFIAKAKASVRRAKNQDYRPC